MTQEELVLDGKTYFSSKRVADLTQYAQDYIGQMCRAGNADCRRVNGLWYVTLESIERHKAVSAEAKARAFENIPPREQNPYEDTVLSFSGEEYVSSKHGADLTGYNPDYITQLARSGKVRARQIGSRWYVARKDLVENKDKNDSLLAEVQSQAVGFAKPAEKTEIIPINRTPTLLNYKPDDAPLMPSIPAPVQPPPITPVVAPATPKTASIASEISEFEGDYRVVPAQDTKSIITKSISRSSKRAYIHLVVASALALTLAVGGYAGYAGGYLTSAGSPEGSVLAATGRVEYVDGPWGLLVWLATDVVSYRRVE